MLYDYTFIMHLFEELEFIKDMEDTYKNLRIGNIKELIEKTIKLCNKCEKNNNTYTFYDNKEEFFISEDDFWENWNEIIDNILYDVIL